jgi:hypothetical protein
MPPSSSTRYCRATGASAWPALPEPPVTTSVTPTSPAHPADATEDTPLPADREASATPAEFRAAVHSLRQAVVRPEVRVESIRPPQRLAPWSYAVAADVRGPDGAELATGRLVLLYDPDGAEAWDGVLRLVAFASADLDPDMAGDPLLPEVGWSWLTGALAERGAVHVAAGGTVTQTTSTRFGDLHGPRTSVALELRGSWTARTPENLGAHLLAFVDLLCTAAGLPPEGVTVLDNSRR